MKKVRLAILAFSFLTIFSPKANSQVIPDNTVNTQVEQNANTAEITGGETRGSNLFHSFQDFSVQTGSEAFFNNANDVSNIFSRVTGGNISSIDGLIRANSNANLFLLNPAGIIFSENARLDIGGSFLATTAETINFSNDQFSAIAKNEPILEIDIPIGLGFGSNTGDISVEGQQNNVSIEIPSFRIITDQIPEGIQVDPGNDISLVGGNINFIGGGLQTPGGNIRLGSVEDNQIVNLNEIDGKFQTNFENITSFKNITFNNAAYIDVSGEIAGNIELNGRQILVQDGSAILANTSQSSENSININASENLELSGTSGVNDSDSSLSRIREIAREIDLNSQNADFGSSTNIDSNFYSISLISADIGSNSSGIGNTININTNDLTVLDAAQIRAGNFSTSSSATGDVNINAQNILVEGTNNIDGFINSEITSTTGIESRGSGGNIRISSQSLQVKDGGQITADSFGLGSAGTLEINSNNILLQGFNPFPGNTSSTGFIGVASISTLPDSNGASIVIETQNLDILDGAKISVSSFGFGTPGSVEIDAEEINIDTGIGTSGTDNNFSGITASVNPVSDLTNRSDLSAESGDININTNSLKILNGARIEADTAAGNSGNIVIDAQDVELNGTRPRVGSFIGGISTSTGGRSFGDGGNVEINATNSLQVLNGSIIRAISLGSGDAGTITINAGDIEIFGVDRFAETPVVPQRVSQINTAALTANGGNIFITSDTLNLDNQVRIGAATTTNGTGGNINIDSSFISLQNLSLLNANTDGGAGGNINIDSDALLGLENSDITANAVTGTGGNINIDSDAILGLEERSQLTAFGDITASSDFGIDGTIAINTPDIDFEKEVFSALQPLIVRKSPQLLERKCLNPRKKEGKLLYIGRGGVPVNPAKFFDDDDEIVAIDRVPTNNHKQTGQRPQVWEEGDPIIGANKIITASNGDTYLVAETDLENIELNLCKAN